jgi:hypothetical protein
MRGEVMADDKQARMAAVGEVMAIACQAVRGCFPQAVNITLVVTVPGGGADAILHDGDIAAAAAALQREIVKERDAAGLKMQ